MRFGSRWRIWQTHLVSTMKRTSGCRDLNQTSCSAKTLWTHLCANSNKELKKMSKDNLQHFPLGLKQSGGTLSASLLLREEIKTHSASAEEYLSKELWVMNPYVSTIKDMEYLGCEDELCDLQAASVSKNFFGSSTDTLLLPDWRNAQLRWLFSHSALHTCLKLPSAPL